MQCEAIEEQFEQHLDKPVPEVLSHLENCSGCRHRWEQYQQLLADLKTLRAPPAPEGIDQRVLAQLESRGMFEPGKPWTETFFDWVEWLLPKAAVLTCLLLIFWMGLLAATRPGPELRALKPESARLWTRLPDAVPPPAFPGPGPAQSRIQVVKK